MNNTVFRIVVSLGLIVVAMNAASAAPPKVTALFPAGCQVGQSVEVTAQGSLGDKPQAWINR